MKTSALPDLPDSDLTVGQLDESEILDLIFPHFRVSPEVMVAPGDDCAQVRAASGSFVVSTDILIEDVHFKHRWSSAYQVGWRAAMQNLADVAAMGARPTSLVVGLAMPKTTEVRWVVDFARGLADAAHSVGAAVVGGDLSSAPQIFISVTVHGDCGGRQPVLRSGAQPGDIVALAGHTGWSAAGLDFLIAQEDEDNSEFAVVRRSHSVESSAFMADNVTQLALQTFRSPTSPIALGEVAAHHGASSLIDVSDGLVMDAQRVCKASGASIEIDYEAMVELIQGPAHHEELSQIGSDESVQPTPVSSVGLREVARDLGILSDAAQDARVARWILTGGEDHALLATFPDGSALPDGFTPIGRVLPPVESSAQGLGTETEQPATQYGAVRVVGVRMGGLEGGWDHFR